MRLLVTRGHGTGVYSWPCCTESLGVDVCQFKDGFPLRRVSHHASVTLAWLLVLSSAGHGPAVGSESSWIKTSLSSLTVGLFSHEPLGVSCRPLLWRRGAAWVLGPFGTNAIIWYCIVLVKQLHSDTINWLDKFRKYRNRKLSLLHVHIIIIIIISIIMLLFLFYRFYYFYVILFF